MFFVPNVRFWKLVVKIYYDYVYLKFFSILINFKSRLLPYGYILSNKLKPSNYDQMLEKGKIGVSAIKSVNSNYFYSYFSSSFFKQIITKISI